MPRCNCINEKHSGSNKLSEARQCQESPSKRANGKSPVPLYCYVHPSLPTSSVLRRKGAQSANHLADAKQQQSGKAQHHDAPDQP